MMRTRNTILRLAATLAVALPGTAVLAPAPAQALDTVTVCANAEVVFNFSPQLTTTSTTGQASAFYAGPCAGADWYSTSGLVPIGHSEYVNVLPDLSRNTAWSGNCALADITAPFWYDEGLLIGGSVLVEEFSSQFGENFELDVLAPLLAPCLEGGAVGSGVAGIHSTSNF